MASNRLILFGAVAKEESCLKHKTSTRQERFIEVFFTKKAVEMWNSVKNDKGGAVEEVIRKHEDEEKASNLGSYSLN